MKKNLWLQDTVVCNVIQAYFECMMKSIVEQYGDQKCRWTMHFKQAAKSLVELLSHDCNTQ